MGTRTVRLVGAAVAAAAAQGTLVALRHPAAARHLRRINFRGRPVTLAGGPALAVGACAGALLAAPDAVTATAAATAGLTAGAVGLYDDIVGARSEQKSAKGFAGHLGALRDGRLTSGLVKIVGVGAAGVVAAALLPPRPTGRHAGARPTGRHAGALRHRTLDVLLGAGVVAGTANLLNLLDLRPGRALKGGLLIGAPLSRGRCGGLAAGPLGAVVALLPADLAEDVMLGDAGANALGAVLGVALTARSGRLARAGILTVLVVLTAASEKVSFTRVIADTPVLREIDALGRRPA